MAEGRTTSFVKQRRWSIATEAEVTSRPARVRRGPSFADALRIHHQDELPVHERLGDVRAKAVTMEVAAAVQLQQIGATF
jgi:hypothetical protein